VNSGIDNPFFCFRAQPLLPIQILLMWDAVYNNKML